MATSWIGQAVTDRALDAAPVPRPPQPTRATWMVFFSAGVNVRDGYSDQGRGGGDFACVFDKFAT